MSSHYAMVERALAYVAAHAPGQPGLAEIAGAVGLSPSHLQRVFTAWAGVSPKTFLEHLTLERAKERMRAGASVLESSLAAGLSGPGRLHDLFVTHEAATPGDFRQRGRGLRLGYGWADSPFGRALILTSERGLCGLSFAAGPTAEDERACLSEAAARWPEATLEERPEEVAGLALRFASRERAEAPLRLSLRGTPFQVQVWRALLQVPPGTLVSYEALARAAGKPASAVRAVATAVGDNPIAFLIPCHRVIRKTGAVSGYRWGRPRKLAMIGWEAAQPARG